MVSLPELFVTLREYNKYNNPANITGTDAGLTGWNVASNVAIGVSVVAGVNFIWQLIRYMRCANPVIPVVATPLVREGGK